MILNFLESKLQAIFESLLSQYKKDTKNSAVFNNLDSVTFGFSYIWIHLHLQFLYPSFIALLLEIQIKYAVLG